MKIVPYSEEYDMEWDDFVINRAANGTIFHERKFLSYHGDRFHDLSLLIFDGEKLVGVFPAALSGDFIISHPGSTYGGLVFLRGLKLADIHKVITAILEWYHELNAARQIVAILPEAFPREDMLDGMTFSLWHHGFRLQSKEISTVIVINNFFAFRGIRKRTIQYIKSEKYKKIGVAYQRATDQEDIRKAYVLIAGNLQRKYDKTPTHTWDEFHHLLELYPDRIVVFVAKQDAAVIATYVVFQLNDQVGHVFYIARDADKLNVADIGLVNTMVEYYQAKGLRYINLGISSRGEEIKWWIHNYKEQFSKDFLTRDTWVYSF